MPVHNKELVGNLTLSLFDSLESAEEAGEEVEDDEWTIVSSVVVVELRSSSGATSIGFQCTDDREWFQTALLEAAARASQE